MSHKKANNEINTANMFLGKGENVERTDWGNMSKSQKLMCISVVTKEVLRQVS